jgi:hypothetical protein
MFAVGAELACLHLDCEKLKPKWPEAPDVYIVRLLS